VFHFDKKWLRIEWHINRPISLVEVGLQKGLIPSDRKQTELFEGIFGVGLNDGINAIAVEEGEYKENVVGSERINI